MFDIRNVAWLIGIDVSLSRSAFGVMCPRSNPVLKKSVAWTRYQSDGTAGSGRKVSTRVRLPTQSSVQVPAHPVRSALVAVVGERELRLLHEVVVRRVDESATAPEGLPIVRWTSDGYGGAVPVATVKDQT